MGRLRSFTVYRRKVKVANIKIQYINEKVVITQYLYTDFKYDAPVPKFNGERITEKDIEDYFESRCFPRERVDCKSILKDMEIDYYEPYWIVQKTHGLLWDDSYWIKFEGESLEWDNIKLRD